MNVIQKARTATVAIVAALLLAGCSPQPSAPAADQSAEQTTAPAETSSAVTVQPDALAVDIVEVVDLETIVVTPREDTSELYGEDIVVHVVNVDAPAPGDCGYDEALALAKEQIFIYPNWWVQYDVTAKSSDVFVDEDGEHYGRLEAKNVSYDTVMINRGFATIPADDTDSVNTSYEQSAKDSGAGLWGTCPDFGA